MPVVDVKNLEGKTVGQMELASDVFSAEVNRHLLHEAVRHHLAAHRAGTHKTKDKSEVSGSGRKLWKQKGTGRARVGSIRSPLWRHGGTVHGPVPRSYEYALPRKMALGALRSALSAKLAQEKLTVVDGWALASHKTKAFRESLSKLDGGDNKILLVENGANVNLERASRNLHQVTLVRPEQLGAYDLLRHERLVLSREAAARLNRALSAEPAREAAAFTPPPADPAKEEVPAAKAKPAAKPSSRTAAKRGAKAPAVNAKKRGARPKGKKD